jgi:hypothetical protein
MIHEGTSMASSKRLLSLSDARAEADKLEGTGRCRARHVAEELAPTGDLTVHTFGQHKREAFLDIAWQEIDDTRCLTPAMAPRTLCRREARCRGTSATPRLSRIGRSLPLGLAVTDAFITVALVQDEPSHHQPLRRRALPGLVHNEDGDGAAGRHLRRD